MKTKPTHLTESTAPASSATATTPMSVGGTCGTGKRKDPTPALMRERQRRKKALAQVRALEALVKSHREEEDRLRRANGDLLLRNEALTSQAEKLAKRLRFLASCKVNMNASEQLAELVLCLHIDPRQLERGSHGVRAYLAEEVMEKLHKRMEETAIQALVKSPIILRNTEAARKAYQSKKQRWIHEFMYDPRRFGEVMALGGQEKLGEIWDMIFEAIKDMAMSVPPGTEIKWVDEKPRERPWSDPGRW